MQTLLRFAATATCLFVLATATAQMAFFPEELFVTAASLNLRDTPDKAGKVLEKLPRGTTLNLVEVVNDGQYVEVDSIHGLWLKVKSKTKTGYVFSPYTSGAYFLCMDRDIMQDSLPPLLWYGIYVRDSFADELRKIEVRLEREYNEFFMEEVDVLYTDQPDTAKFIVGSATPLKPGYAGNLGLFGPDITYYSSQLSPGAMLPIHPGIEDGDESEKSTYYFAATGCAYFGDYDYVHVTDYRLYTMEMMPGTTSLRQDMTGWVQPEVGLNPNVALIWYGDLDGDNKPDAILEDAPYEIGARISLFLSSKAQPGMLLHKVCEYFYVID
ncbi:MAG: SH3 domain-containing protein [Lewinellaceae bacterium]|nr:SH3 domain-containing protein [Lewinellaceae bacterium]